MIRIKSIYERYSTQDGYRILVDRLWPRGIKRETAAIDLWLKEIAPTNELRKWYSHDPEKFEEFKKRYFSELERNGELIEKIKQIEKNSTVTLLYSSKSHLNNATILLEFLNKAF
ncbi:MAG TPA: DUF488 domain-containing protein [Thermodesulfobium narugense]|uniref:Uncharacterized conserved protein YeaO, DUF488 family n=1 Tax=Thermodesulfobium acidiphilum TaxID=1794699 RepID=A0A2R4VYL6_THEAF|nr:DUF488 domain-containing protein [Thermodesulfobium acidiphilum]AWB09633.1 Uncharacterized conserved protein YeaO, DUF488 family [Thermodesulfobium acidiphilum]PMP85551.1 MAG: hypothetical protein C0174_04075 [Thermodesulfobium narugense]HEM55199.1 DUF488 domain-containing protein [Thermodesulfobium narugense]